MKDLLLTSLYRTEYIGSLVSAHDMPLDDGQTDYHFRLGTAHEEAYSSVVQEYTRRHLSFPTDILNAFSAISARLQEVFRTTLVSGLPLSIIDFALMWVPASSGVCRRAPVSPAGSGITDVAFPSWSWSGWIGPVLYMRRQDSVRRVDYEIIAMPGIQDPCAVNHEAILLDVEMKTTDGLWLDNRTSILADEYPSSVIRDSQGDAVGCLLDCGSTPARCFTDLKHFLIILSHLDGLTKCSHEKLYSDNGLYMDSFVDFCGAPSCITNVMLVRWTGELNFFERVAIGQFDSATLSRHGYSAREWIRLI